jgi:hypothetical protein
MASIIGKKIKGQTYYYLREVARVGGKPKIVSQRYLGKAADIEAAVSGASATPDRTRHLGFGDLASVWGMLERLGVVEIIDDVVGARRGDAGASVGTYLALATANRVVDPCSKRKFADWWKTTAGDRFVPVGQPRWITDGSGRPWMPFGKNSCQRSSAASSRAWSRRFLSTCRVWCST